MPSPPLNEPCTWNVLFTCVCFMFQIYAGRTLKGSVQHWIPSWWLISRNLVCSLSTVCSLFSAGLSCIRLSISGLDSCARFWDLRSGKCIMLFEGHLKNVLSLDFSPNGWVTIHFWILFSLIHSSTHQHTDKLVPQNEGTFALHFTQYTSPVDFFLLILSSTH